MEPIGLPLPRQQGAPQTSSGELISQNGRQSGLRRPLTAPLTLIGRAPGCDIRLNVEGIDAIHCVLFQGPEGLALRDLDSSSGTFVNAQRISHASVQDGDMISIGTSQLRLHLPQLTSEQAGNGLWDPARVQSAAVAAQQVALTEEEYKLAERRTALAKQEEQLAAHLEEKRRGLLEISERAQAERTLLENDRAAHEQHLEKVTGDLTVGQRELLEGQKKNEAERKRLVELQRRLRSRWHRYWLMEREKYERRQDALTAEARRLEEQAALLQEREEALAEKRLRFNTLYEVGRGRLREAWELLRQNQFRWKHRRGDERAALKVRERDVENAERDLAEAQRLLLKEKRIWDSAKTTLGAELEAMEMRVAHERQGIAERQDEIVRLDAEILARQKLRSDLPELPLALPEVQTGDAGGDIASSGNAQEAVAEANLSIIPYPGQGQEPPGRPAGALAPVPPFLSLQVLRQNGAAGQGDSILRNAAILRLDDAENGTGARQRRQDMERLAAALADQRAQLLEQWQRLAQIQARWEKDRFRASLELETLARRLVDNGHVLAEREKTGAQADLILRHRHEELVQLRQQLIAWRARLRVREKAWEAERQKLLAEVRNREELADHHLHALVDLRQRWARRRRDEVEKLRSERGALDLEQRAQSQARLAVAEQTTALDAEKRVVAEKALALEQYRQELLSKAPDPAAERRVERLRRRWITLNAAAIRTATREREALKSLLQSMDSRQVELQAKAHELTKGEIDLVEKQTAWEHKQTLATARQARIHQELQGAETQRKLAEQQVVRMKDEIERIARSLIDEPDPPTSEALDQAA